MIDIPRAARSQPRFRSAQLPVFLRNLAALLACLVPLAHAQTVLRIAPQSNLAVLDPIWTTATVTRTHGYMIYDTLFGTDANNRVQPQMVESWSVSDDRRTWSFTLREGLEFHDGRPVTSEDVVASLARWGKRDATGQKLYSFVALVVPGDARHFRILLKEPYGLVLESLGKPGANVPFIMPRRVAETPADKQIDDTIGSGPYIFKKDEWKPGALVVYVKNPKYKPRHDPPSGTAGAKLAKIERVEWHIIKDAQTQVNALIAGEIDLLEQPAHEHYAALRADPNVRVLDNKHGAGVILRFNHLHPPFNNPKLRQAALAAFTQEPFLKAQFVSKDLYRTCASMYPCGTPYASSKGTERIVKSDMKLARQLLKEGDYDGTPVVIMKPTDLATIAKLPDVAAQYLRQAGFKVDLQAMDWQTLVSRRAKREAPAQGGWNIFITTFNGQDLLNPLVSPPLAGSCDRAWFGWSCDEKLEQLREQFVRATGDADKKRIAEAVQVRAAEIGTHANLGEYFQPVAVRKNITGYLNAPVYLYWNIEKR